MTTFHEQSKTKSIFQKLPLNFYNSIIPALSIIRASISDTYAIMYWLAHYLVTSGSFSLKLDRENCWLPALQHEEHKGNNYIKEQFHSEIKLDYVKMEHSYLADMLPMCVQNYICLCWG